MTDNFGLGGDYLDSWDQFIGQELAVRQLRAAAKSARMRLKRMDHVLLKSGSPGIGKTQLSLLVAREMGTQVKIIAGKVPPNQARMTLAGMEDGDVLFWDEIHMAVQGGKANAEWLLHFLQDGVLMGPTGPEECPDVTLIGATTDAGRLPETITGRIPLQPVLVDYTEHEAMQIAMSMCPKIFGTLPMPSEENCRAVAEATVNNPRLMRSLLINLRDIALTSDQGNVTSDGYDLTEAMEWLGVSEDGLSLLAQRYIVVLYRQFADGAGESALKDILQEPGGLGQVERILMRKELIAKTKRGRTLTSTGIRRARQVIAAQDATA